MHPSDPLEPLRTPSGVAASRNGRLESFLLVPGSRLSCSVRLQLVPREGSLGRSRGEERESAAYHISEKGVCSSPTTSTAFNRTAGQGIGYTTAATGTMEPYVSSLKLVGKMFLSTITHRLVSTIHTDIYPNALLIV